MRQQERHIEELRFQDRKQNRSRMFEQKDRLDKIRIQLHLFTQPKAPVCLTARVFRVLRILRGGNAYVPILRFPIRPAAEQIDITRGELRKNKSVGARDVFSIAIVRK